MTNPAENKTPKPGDRVRVVKSPYDSIPNGQIYTVEKADLNDNLIRLVESPSLLVRLHEIDPTCDLKVGDTVRARDIPDDLQEGPSWVEPMGAYVGRTATVTAYRERHDDYCNLPFPTVELDIDEDKHDWDVRWLDRIETPTEKTEDTREQKEIRLGDLVVINSLTEKGEKFVSNVGTTFHNMVGGVWTATYRHNDATTRIGQGRTEKSEFGIRAECCRRFMNYSHWIPEIGDKVRVRGPHPHRSKATENFSVDWNPEKNYSEVCTIRHKHNKENHTFYQLEDKDGKLVCVNSSVYHISWLIPAEDGQPLKSETPVAKTENKPEEKKVERCKEFTTGQLVRIAGYQKLNTLRCHMTKETTCCWECGSKIPTAGFGIDPDANIGRVLKIGSIEPSGVGHGILLNKTDTYSGMHWLCPEWCELVDENHPATIAEKKFLGILPMETDKVAVEEQKSAEERTIQDEKENTEKLRKWIRELQAADAHNQKTIGILHQQARDHAEALRADKETLKKYNDELKDARDLAEHQVITLEKERDAAQDNSDRLSKIILENAKIYDNQLEHIRQLLTAKETNCDWMAETLNEIVKEFGLNTSRYIEVKDLLRKKFTREAVDAQGEITTLQDRVDILEDCLVCMASYLDEEDQFDLDEPEALQEIARVMKIELFNYRKSHTQEKEQNTELSSSLHALRDQIADMQRQMTELPDAILSAPITTASDEVPPVYYSKQTSWSVKSHKTIL